MEDGIGRFGREGRWGRGREVGGKGEVGEGKER